MSVPQQILDFIADKYRKVYDRTLGGVKYFNYNGDNIHYILEINYRQIHNVSATRFAKAALERGKVVVLGNCKVLYINRRFKPEVGFALFTKAYDNMMQNIQYMRHTINAVTSQDFKLMMLDILSLVLNMREGYLTFTKMGSILISLYTTYRRFHNMFECQAGPGLTDLVLGFGLLGAPTLLLEKLKAFNALTGKRVIDSESVMMVLSKFFELLRSVLDFLHEPVGGVKFIPDSVHQIIVIVLDKIGTQLRAYNLIKSITECYSTYVRTPQVMFDPSYRENVMKLYDNAKGDEDFLQYVSDGNSKYFSLTWQLFRDNVVKSVTAFQESRRDEPICIVFEGTPGSGKSFVMNAFVDLLRKSNMSVYCHAFPASEDGKDFYDDYENQEVFVVDDIGQQGVSQWRYIINFVSPVKYPLPCATASKKNTKFFNSKVILCTTNCLKDLNSVTKSDCISDLNALKRRCHVVYFTKRDDGTGVFAQDMQYFKFDHLSSLQWEPMLLHHNVGSIPVHHSTADMEPNVLKRTEASLKFVWQLYRHIRRCEDANRHNIAVNDELLERVLNMEPEALPQLSDLFLGVNGFRVAGVGLSLTNVLCEWYDSIKRILSKWFTKSIELLGFLTSGQLSYTFEFFGVSITVNPVVCALLIALGVCTWCFFFQDEGKIDDFEAKFVKLCANLEKDGLKFVPRYYQAQALPPVRRIEEIRKFCKTIRVKEDKHERDDDVISQCIVSGRFVLLPAHVDAHGKRIDIHATWEHFKNNHVEVENARIVLCRKFIGCDLAIYSMDRTIPCYKNCNNLFPDVNVKNVDLYLANSLGSCPVVFGKHVTYNDSDIEYGSVTGRFKHTPMSGVLTPYSGNGVCGTVLADAFGGIVGYHVAGNGTEGFCVIPTREVAREIRSIMCGGSESKFELDTKVIPNFSGVRARYEEGEVKKSHPIKESSFVKTSLHEDYSDDMVSIKQLFALPGVAYYDGPISSKEPPRFRNNDQTAQDKLVEMSQKTFMRQGYITSDEATYISNCLDSMMVHFGDISDEVCAFGNEDFQPLNKDSSNGYGCLREKEDYFDFQNHIIKDEARQLISNFEQAALKDETNYNYFLCKETFKDELRAMNKVDSPRTFRVMPLGHIWWTKKIFGNVITHFKNNKHKYGCSIGFNPYTDFDVLAKKLLNCQVTGDVDFAKWDGSVMAHVMELIYDSLMRFYTGSHREVAQYIFMTMWNSHVLVGDAVWITTHGLPSGTWLTLLLNCLINKALTALVLYRNKPKANVEDFHKIVDYVMGDDKLFGCDAEIGKYYNLKTIEKVASSLGMTCTNGDKTKITSISQPFHKLSFVKRNFVKHITLKKYMGALSLATIHNTLQWRDSTRDITEVMHGKMRSVQVEAYIHSPRLYEEYTKLFYKHDPFAPLFGYEQVEKILSSPDGYNQVATYLDKQPERWM
jgi:hypothetical protein